MAHKITKTLIPDLLVLQPAIYTDQRGFFMETYNQKDFEKVTGLSPTFVQDNHSRSQKGVIRGLHFQQHHPQGKLVRVVAGAVFDVAVDIRPMSKTYSQWFGIELSAKNNKQLWIPPGFAHGFQVLTENADVLYKTTEFYDPKSETGILWNDVTLAIKWQNIAPPIISDKDLNLNTFEAMRSLF